MLEHIIPNTFYVYLATAIICLYGMVLFLWWWRVTGKATEVYRYVTVLLAAVFIEKSVKAWLRYSSHFGSDIEAYGAIVTSPWWWAVGLPTLFAFGMIVFAMTKRIWKSNRALNRSPELTLPHKSTNRSRSVLVISVRNSTKKFMKEVFVSNDVEYRQASSFINGLEMLVSEYRISVIMIGLSAIESAGIRPDDAVRLVKKERPWAIVVALTRSPNMYELMEARRSFFDDYIYLPVDAANLMSGFDRWCRRIERWKNMGTSDRRKKDGNLEDRKNIILRKFTGVPIERVPDTKKEE